ncbi:MAG: AIR synthase-related protein, partial [Acidimicrobiia bacterium]
LVPVLHDVSDGGLAVTVAEICIASGVGAELIELTAEEWLCEDPHRFVVAMPPDAVSLPAGLSRKIGALTGTTIQFGNDSVDLATAKQTYEMAIPRRMSA